MGECKQQGATAATVDVIRAPGSGEVRIVVRGRLDFGSVFRFRNAYEYAPSASRYIVDLTAADAMTGSAMGMLLNLRAFAQQSGAKVVIRGASEDFRELLGLSRLSDAFECVAKV